MIAESVVDIDDEEQPEPPGIVLAGDAKKEAAELAVFKEFAAAPGLLVESPENARPPHPDIRCMIDGQPYWFELGRITDSLLAEQISMKPPYDPEPFSFGQEEPFVRIVEKKAKARYETNGRDVDLVLHFDQQPPDRTALSRHLQKHAAALDKLQKHGPFSRIWIYDGWSKSVLWQSAE